MVKITLKLIGMKRQNLRELFSELDTLVGEFMEDMPRVRSGFCVIGRKPEEYEEPSVEYTNPEDEDDDDLDKTLDEIIEKQEVLKNNIEDIKKEIRSLKKALNLIINPKKIDCTKFYKDNERGKD